MCEHVFTACNKPHPEQKFYSTSKRVRVLGLRLWLGLDYQWSNACPGLPQKIGVWLLGVACSLVAGVLAVQARGPAITSPSASHMRARAHTHHTHSRQGG